MQYNISRIEGQPPRGFDQVIDGRRQLITEGSDKASEQRIVAAMGSTSVLPRREEVNGHLVYDVPFGTRLLIKTLIQSPYSERYMRRLAASAGDFMRRLRQLDPGLFGIQLEHIAITHNAGTREDDTALTVVPPVLPAGQAEPQSDEAILGHVHEQHLMDPELIPPFANGLKGVDYDQY